MECLTQIDDLRQAIRRRQFEPGAMVGTEFAFSQQWGLSRYAVRRGIEVLVEEGLLERRAGKGLFVRTPHTPARTVQMVVPNLAYTCFVLVARGAQDAGRERGVEMQVCEVRGDMREELERLRRLPDGSTEGAIIISLHNRRFSEVLFELKAKGYPFVLVDQRLHDLEVPTVEVDNYGGAYTIGKELTALGHERVAFLGPLNLRIIGDRLAGFRDAFADARVLFDRSLIVNLEGDDMIGWLHADIKGNVERAVLPLLSKPNRPTAIFDATGEVAAFIYRTAQSVGLRIPEDLSVVTFDNAGFSHVLDPEVARLSYPWVEMGKAAFEMLSERMARKSRGLLDQEDMHHRVVSAEWMPGQSLSSNTEVN